MTVPAVTYTEQPTMLLEEAPLELGQVVTSLQVPDITCPRCGGPVTFVNQRPPGRTGYSAMVLLHCQRNGCPTWELRVEWITCGQPPSTPTPAKEC